MDVPTYDKQDKKGPCYHLIKAVKWIPVLFIVAILGWSYYAYVIQLCLVAITSSTKKALYLIIYHMILIMLIWTYCKTMLTDVGEVPKEFKLSKSENERLMRAESEESIRRILEKFSKNLPLKNFNLSGTVRYCNKCHHIKPDRAHHCSVCGVCILKMDHHCPWINNCVSFTNYKFFLLFLSYSLLYCVYISATSVQYFIAFWVRDMDITGKFHIVFLFFVALTFSVSLVSLFGYHCYLVIHNRTTLEAFRPAVFNSGPDKNGFNLGAYNNIQQVFGDNLCVWFIPIDSSFGDGITYPVHSRHQTYQSYHSLDSTTAIP